MYPRLVARPRPLLPFDSMGACGQPHLVEDDACDIDDPADGRAAQD